MKRIMYYFLLIATLILHKNVLAAELRVIRIGSGDGFILDDQQKLWCGDECNATYEENTLVHLQVEPYPDCIFIGWLVNDQPHEGNTFLIKHDVLIKAVFERTGKNELQIFWYDGDRKKYAMIVLDEIAVFLERQEISDRIASERQDALLPSIREHFHPSAVIAERYGKFLILVKSPAFLTKTKLFKCLQTLQNLNDIQAASPVLYIEPKHPATQRILTGEITVKFPRIVTSDDIYEIEADFQLQREGRSVFGYIYRANTPWEALQLANRIYESGRVEYAIPEMIKWAIPDN